MTVSTTDNRIPYSGNGVTTAFDFPYKFLSTGDLKVYVDDVLMTLTTDYSVGTPSDDGATVTFVVAPAAGTNNIVILRDPDLLQQSALPSNGPFPSTSVETMVDKVTLQVQRLKELVTRSFRLSDADATGASTVLPTPEALKVIGWSNDGLSLVNTDASTLATVVTAGNPIYEFFDGDAVTTEFTVASATLGSLPATKVFISGVRQSPGTDYTISDATVTFMVAPPSGTNNILVEWTDAIAAVGVPSDGSITLAKLVDGLFTVTSTALGKFADGFFSATAEARAKFADGFLTTSKLDDQVFNGLPTVTFDSTVDHVVISDGSDGGNKKKALLIINPTNKIFDIDATVAGNDLTITVNNGVWDFRSTTLTDGTPVTRTLSSPVSLVIPNGATLGSVNAVSSRYVVGLLDNAGVLEPFVINMAGGNQLDETNLITTTAISTGADSNNVAYSATGRSNLAYRIIGFIDITEATAGVYATAPTLVQGCGGQALTSLSSLGYGLSTQSSLALATTYYNTTGKPIALAVSALISAGGAGSYISCTVDGIKTYGSTIAVNGTYSTLVIPSVRPGASYLFTLEAGATVSSLLVNIFR